MQPTTSPPHDQIKRQQERGHHANHDERFFGTRIQRHSTTNIYESAHISKATLFYFGSKRNLFSGIHKKSLAGLLEPFVGAASQLENPCERYIFLIREFAKIVCRQPELRILVHETLAINDS